MKKNIIIIGLFMLSVTVQAQFSASIVQTLDTAYLAMLRINTTPYVAALRTGALDIRQTAPGSFGNLRQVVPLADVSVNGKLELYDNYAYVLDYGITVIDLHDPLEPMIVSAGSLPSFTSASARYNDLLFISVGNTCYVYSLTDPSLPALIDSAETRSVQIKQSENILYTIKPAENKIYSWSISAETPCLVPEDSMVVSADAPLLSMDVSGDQLIVKTIDSLYRYRTTDALSIISKEKMPDFPFNAQVIARDTNILAYLRYNSLYVSSGINGNAFIDSAEIMVDGNYTLSGGLLDNDLFYTNTAKTYLIEFNGSSTSIPYSRPGPEYLHIYPNPAADMIELNIGGGDEYIVQITNMLGQLHLSGRMHNTQCRFDISNLPAGVYLITIQDLDSDKIKISGNFIKQ